MPVPRIAHRKALPVRRIARRKAMPTRRRIGHHLWRKRVPPHSLRPEINCRNTKSSAGTRNQSQEHASWYRLYGDSVFVELISQCAGKPSHEDEGERRKRMRAIARC
eukprot:310524-Rhodomonas_salina.1